MTRTRAVVRIGLITLILAVVGVSEVVVRQASVEYLLAGTWLHPLYRYAFTAEGTMTRRMAGSDHGTVYRYSIADSTGVMILGYRTLSPESTTQGLIAIADITDSTALIADGIAFAREGEGSGLKGTWLRVTGLTVLRWRISSSSMTYDHRALDPATGEYSIIEERSGVFQRGETPEDAGRFTLTFQDGRHVVLFPLLAGNVLYMFELTPRRALFARADDMGPPAPPTVSLAISTPVSSEAVSKR